MLLRSLLGNCARRRFLLPLIIFSAPREGENLVALFNCVDAKSRALNKESTSIDKIVVRLFPNVLILFFVYDHRYHNSKQV